MKVESTAAERDVFREIPLRYAGKCAAYQPGKKVLVSQAFPAKKAQQPKIDVGGPEKLIIFSWPNLRLYFCMVAKFTG